MATLKLQTKTGTDPVRNHMRRQATWIRNEEKLKNWRKVSTNNVEKLSRNTSHVHLSERKSDTTCSRRSSDYNSQSTSSSSEPTSIKRLQDCEDLEEKQTIEKCLKWMETLPTKFSGMHIFVQPTEIENS